MLVVLTADMEGVSQLVGPNEIIACCDEYWATGKPRYEADVAAACRGLLAGGADEVVVLDNHASGNTYNIPQDALPAGARLEEWHVFDLPGRGVGAMLQVGYHARGGVEGFLSHTYAPGLRLRVGDELISESHARAWAAGVPLLGIVGNDVHARTLGSLDGTPYLVVQETRSRSAATPVFGEAEGLDAIEAFAEQCVRERDGATVPMPAGRCHVRREHAERSRGPRRDGGGGLVAHRRRRVRRRARELAGRPRAAGRGDERRDRAVRALLADRALHRGGVCSR